MGAEKGGGAHGVCRAASSRDRRVGQVGKHRSEPLSVDVSDRIVVESQPWGIGLVDEGYDVHERIADADDLHKLW